ncbi:type VII secretion protein EccB [Pedococcus sp. KACC 23699]|uniref:Type VII secretion protein EccB n=1 Tax=Pedococcus sp. KACC 23699 TaxID=3149228 RepID=A0AAU7JU88_9MICO
MATKKDLVEAQAFSRRRLTTAFVSGAPGGREVEPQRPMRAVIGSIALSVLLVVGGIAVGYLKPSLPSGWDDNSLVIAKKSGARYVAIKKTLYPVINTTSARLLIPSDTFKVVTVDDDKITNSPRGATIGILGAPDSLPAADRLVNSGWTACVGQGGGIAATIGGPAAPPATGQATVVRTDGSLYVVTGGYRLPLRARDATAVLRALRLDTVTPLDVPSTWTGLFPIGPTLSPLTLDNAGAAVPGLPPGAVVGSVLAVATPGADPRRYLVTPTGELAPLPPFAYALYLLGSGQSAGADIAVTPAQVGSLRNASSSIVPKQWPETVPNALSSNPCVTLTASYTKVPTVALTTSTTRPPSEGTAVVVAAGTGALVRAIASNIVNRGPVLAVDQTGSSYPVTPATDDVLARLGYAAKDVTPVPQAWMELFRSGPGLSTRAAQSAISQGR